MLPQIPCAHFSNRRRLRLGVVAHWQDDRNVTLAESRNLVVIGRVAEDLMGGAIAQVQVQHLRAFADKNPFFRNSDLRPCRVTDVGQEHASPFGSFRPAVNIVDIKD